MSYSDLKKLWRYTYNFFWIAFWEPFCLIVDWIVPHSVKVGAGENKLLEQLCCTMGFDRTRENVFPLYLTYEHFTTVYQNLYLKSIHFPICSLLIFYYDYFLCIYDFIDWLSGEHPEVVDFFPEYAFFRDIVYVYLLKYQLTGECNCRFIACLNVRAFTILLYIYLILLLVSRSYMFKLLMTPLVESLPGS